MRLLIVCACCVLAAPASAQRFEAQTINGVRVWSPKSLIQGPGGPLPPPEPQTTGTTASAGRIDEETINGVRVWSPKPQPPEPKPDVPLLPGSQPWVGLPPVDPLYVPPLYATPLYAAPIYGAPLYGDYEPYGVLPDWPYEGYSYDLYYGSLTGRLPLSHGRYSRYAYGTHYRSRPPFVARRFPLTQPTMGARSFMSPAPRFSPMPLRR
jgi:hypothetical protein